MEKLKCTFKNLIFCCSANPSRSAISGAKLFLLHVNAETMQSPKLPVKESAPSAIFLGQLQDHLFILSPGMVPSCSQDAQQKLKVARSHQFATCSSEAMVTFRKSWPEMCDSDSSSNSFKVSNTQLWSKTLCDHQFYLTTKPLRKLPHLYHRIRKSITSSLIDQPLGCRDVCCAVNRLVILKCGGFTGNVTYFCFTVCVRASLRYCVVVCWYSLIEYNEAAVRHWPSLIIHSLQLHTQQNAEGYSWLNKVL